MALTPEGKVKAAVKAVLREMGAWFFMPMQNGMGVVGIPDFVGCYRGWFFAIETKAPGKGANTTVNQERRLNEVRGAQGVALVIDTTDKAAIRLMLSCHLPGRAMALSER